MPKDKNVDWNKMIFGNCPFCEKAAYHKVKKPVYMFMDGVEVKIFVYKCSKCKKRWGMY